MQVLLLLMPPLLLLLLLMPLLLLLVLAAAAAATTTTTAVTGSASVQCSPDTPTADATDKTSTQMKHKKCTPITRRAGT